MQPPTKTLTHPRIFVAPYRMTRSNIRTGRSTPIHVTPYDSFIRGVQLTTEMFTAAVFVYSGLNFLMYRRIRRDIEKTSEKPIEKKKEEKHDT